MADGVSKLTWLELGVFVPLPYTFVKVKYVEVNYHLVREQAELKVNYQFSQF